MALNSLNSKAGQSSRAMGNSKYTPIAAVIMDPYVALHCSTRIADALPTRELV
jgi:hypothetical protein